MSNKKTITLKASKKLIRNKINNTPLIDLKAIKITKNINKKKLRNAHALKITYNQSELSNTINSDLKSITKDKETKKKLSEKINNNLKTTFLNITKDLKELKIENIQYSKTNNKSLLHILEGRYNSSEQIVSIAFYIKRENLTIDFALPISTFKDIKKLLSKKLLSKTFINGATNTELKNKISVIKAQIALDKTLKPYDLNFIA